MTQAPSKRPASERTTDTPSRRVVLLRLPGMLAGFFPPIVFGAILLGCIAQFGVGAGIMLGCIAGGVLCWALAKVIGAVAPLRWLAACVVGALAVSMALGVMLSLVHAVR
ncbi:hypothetical protein [Novosphingobium sp. Leaf2]|uniref:hypothetical protein n=1 Tax=Novosphingobium sp. Leaf2 TaxID=1735670 RepID=UPI000713E48F|nr:hypothetical protein [Novosphingobium sp. Leaf2]KQM19317.1 hypothetical protein ASE49_03465 [Novosphingobium sp. Leaf2]